MSTTTHPTAEATALCGQCTYWKNVDSNTGECRRHAPQTIAFTVDQDLKFESRFPRTKASDWCGDFSAAR
ncbi:MAG: hypothetical protein ACREIA_01720 [Opitutaceae bacterium]